MSAEAAATPAVPAGGAGAEAAAPEESREGYATVDLPHDGGAGAPASPARSRDASPARVAAVDPLGNLRGGEEQGGAAGSIDATTIRANRAAVEEDEPQLDEPADAPGAGDGGGAWAKLMASRVAPAHDDDEDDESALRQTQAGVLTGFEERARAKYVVKDAEHGAGKAEEETTGRRRITRSPSQVLALYGSGTAPQKSGTPKTRKVWSSLRTATQGASALRKAGAKGAQRRGSSLVTGTDGYPLLHPHRPLRLILDAVAWAVALALVVVAPLDLALDGMSDPERLLPVVDGVLSALSLADVALELRTAYPRWADGAAATSGDDELEQDPGAIFSRYARKYLYVDLLSSLPIGGLLGWATGASAVRHWANVAIRPLRIARLRSFGRGQIRVHLHAVTLYAEVLMLLLYTCMLAHFFACLISIGSRRRSHDGGLPWFMLDFDLEPEAADDPFKRYLAALIASSALCIGLGNVTSNLSPEEGTLLAVLQFVGSLCWATILGTVLDTIHRVHAESHDFDRERDRLVKWLARNKVEQGLIDAALHSFSYQYERTGFVDDQDLLARLSPAMQLSLRRALCRGIVARIKLFDQAPGAFIDEVTSRLDPRYVPAGDVVCSQGEVGECMYLLAKGEVEVLKAPDSMLREDGSVIGGFAAASSEKMARVCVLTDGSFFGEIALVDSGAKRVCTCRALKNCELFTLMRRDFDALLNAHPEMHATFAGIAEARLGMTQRLISRKRSLNKTTALVMSANRFVLAGQERAKRRSEVEGADAAPVGGVASFHASKWKAGAAKAGGAEAPEPG